MVKLLPKNPRIIFVSRYSPGVRVEFKLDNQGKIIGDNKPDLSIPKKISIPTNLQTPQLRTKFSETKAEKKNEKKNEKKIVTIVQPIISPTSTFNFDIRPIFNIQNLSSDHISTNNKVTSIISEVKQ